MRDPTHQRPEYTFKHQQTVPEDCVATNIARAKCPKNSLRSLFTFVLQQHMKQFCSTSFWNNNNNININISISYYYLVVYSNRSPCKNCCFVFTFSVLVGLKTKFFIISVLVGLKIKTTLLFCWVKNLFPAPFPFLVC